MYSETDFTLDTEVSFITHGLLGGVQTFEGVVAGVVNPRSLPATANAAVNHSNIYPTLPAATKEKVLDNHLSYNYVALETNPGTIIYIGIPWISDSSLVLLTNRMLSVPILNFKEENYDRLRKVLRGAGYEVGDISG